MSRETGVVSKLRRHRKSYRRSRLLSLFIASSIQQGGASEPVVQPGQARGLCEAGVQEGWGVVGRGMMCVGV